MLLNLESMRRSKLYNSLLKEKALVTLAHKFLFKGDSLREQDFFTLISLKHPHLFYILPQEWNHQLCMGWRDRGYEDVFDLYNKSDAPTKVYHANNYCAMPDD